MALAAGNDLAGQGKPMRVVSMPCWEAFESQPASYRKRVLGALPILSVEAGVTLGWRTYADASVGIDRFGASAPGSVVLRTDWESTHQM